VPVQGEKQYLIMSSEVSRGIHDIKTVFPVFGPLPSAFGSLSWAPCPRPLSVAPLLVWITPPPLSAAAMHMHPNAAKAGPA